MITIKLIKFNHLNLMSCKSNLPTPVSYIQPVGVGTIGLIFNF